MKYKLAVELTNLVAKSIARRTREIASIWMPGFSIHRKKFFILEDQKVIYVPISKAANSTVKKLLLSGLGLNTFSPDDPYYVHRGKEFSHFTKRRLPRDHRNYFMFTVVREDELRLRSCYKNKFQDSAKVSARGFEFSEYLGGYLKPSDSYTEFLNKVEMLPNHIRDEHLVQQYYWVYGVHKCNPRLYCLDQLESLSEDLRSWGLSVGSVSSENSTETHNERMSSDNSPNLMVEIGNA